MSIYATNFVIDEEGNSILIKHLNKIRVDRGGWNMFSRAKGWNKSGKRNRMEKESKILTIKERRYWKLKCKKELYGI